MDTQKLELDDLDFKRDWELLPIALRIPPITRTSLNIDADALLKPLTLTMPSGGAVWKTPREVMVSYAQMMLKDFDRIDMRQVRVGTPSYFEALREFGDYLDSFFQAPKEQCEQYIEGSWGEPIAYADHSPEDSSDEPIPEEPANEPTAEEIEEDRQEMDKLQWEMDHPECRCPPRE